MGKINIGRLILAGLVAGLISDALAYLVDGVILAERWSDGMAFLNHSQFSAMQWVWFNVVGLLGGMVAVWIYVGIRPRFGAGPVTAIYAGIAVWLLSPRSEPWSKSLSEPCWEPHFTRKTRTDPRKSPTISFFNHLR